MYGAAKRTDSYVLSTTDLMVGILFIVLVIIFYLAFITANVQDLAATVEGENKSMVEAVRDARAEAREAKKAAREAIARAETAKQAESESDARAEAAKRAESESDARAEAAKRAESEAIARAREAKAAAAEMSAENRQLKMAYIEVNEALEGILEKIRKKMKLRGFPVEVVVKRGIIRLPEKRMFDKGEFVFSPGGKINMSIMAEVLREVLPCYVGSTHPEFEKQRGSCVGISHKIEAVFLEGHADVQPVRENPRYRDNEELSTKRALSAFGVINNDDVLKHFVNHTGEYLFGVSGYGETRPICEGKNESCYEQNRRIDLRFMMQPPKPKNRQQAN